MKLRAISIILQLLVMYFKYSCTFTLRNTVNSNAKPVVKARHRFRLFASLTKQRVVFLGTPSVAAQTLSQLHAASLVQNSTFELVSIVTQPPAEAGRNKKLTKSAVHELAEKLNFPVLYPDSAKDAGFLDSLEQLKVDLFITAAYGNYLPKRFLNIAKFGTINIHPSLLPKYRGAAPVQRCLENGDDVTGVTVLYSVAKMDAGPILHQEIYPLKGDEKANQVLDDCFRLGTSALVNLLPSIFDGSAATILQDDAKAIPAPKLEIAEGLINFSALTALQIHNKCRAFSDWPGTYAYFSISSSERQRVKIITTKVINNEVSGLSSEAGSICVYKEPKNEIIAVRCKDGTILGILELQPAGKKVMVVKAFINGLRGQLNMKWISS